MCPKRSVLARNEMTRMRAGGDTYFCCWLLHALLIVPKLISSLAPSWFCYRWLSPVGALRTVPQINPSDGSGKTSAASMNGRGVAIRLVPRDVAADDVLEVQKVHKTAFFF